MHRILHPFVSQRTIDRRLPLLIFFLLAGAAPRLPQAVSPVGFGSRRFGRGGGGPGLREGRGFELVGGGAGGQEWTREVCLSSG